MARTIFYGQLKNNAKVTFEPNIGLDAASRQAIVEILKLLLADETVLASKTHQAHAGSSGTELNSVCEKQYQQLVEVLDAITERISILGGMNQYSAKELIDLARLDGKSGTVSDAMGMLADHEAFIRFLREDAQKCSDEFGDQGTFAMLVGILRQHEKMAWVLRSFIEPGGEGNHPGSDHQIA
jgi:starvation-inducible DNA-binding protein